MTRKPKVRVMYSEDGGRYHEPRNAGNLLEAGKGNEIDFPPEASRRNTALLTA